MNSLFVDIEETLSEVVRVMKDPGGGKDHDIDSLEATRILMTRRKMKFSQGGKEIAHTAQTVWDDTLKHEKESSSGQKEPHHQLRRDNQNCPA